MGSRRGIPARSATGLVWVLALCSVYLVARYGSPVFFDLGATCRLMVVRDADGIHSALGLTYTGVWGAILVACEIVGVVGALGLSCSREPEVRRTALLLLLAWATLWLANALWLEDASGWAHPLRTPIIGAGFLSACLMAATRWGGANA